MSTYSPPPSPVPIPMVEPQPLAVTRINVLEKLFHVEVELHQNTKSMLMQSQAYCKAWEHAHNDAKSELHHLQIQLSAVEQAARDVLMENNRLKLILNHISSYRDITPTNSDYTEAAVEECSEYRNDPTVFATGEIPIAVDRKQ